MKKRHSVEQIIRILREAENGLKGLDVARKHNISEHTLHDPNLTYKTTGPENRGQSQSSPLPEN